MQNENIFKNTLANFLDSFRCCANCGYFKTTHNTLLCEYCYQAVLETRKNKLRELPFNGQVIQAFSLFDWVPQKNNALSALMLNLKGTTSPDIWLYYAAMFLNYRIAIADIGKNSILVPCPNKGQRADHASQFTDALSSLTLIPRANLLEMNSSVHFKVESRLERQLNLLNRLKLSENITQSDLSEKHIIFIDDIITTGTTVKSARFHLSSAKSFQAWSLSYRTL